MNSAGSAMSMNDPMTLSAPSRSVSPASVRGGNSESESRERDQGSDSSSYDESLADRGDSNSDSSSSESDEEDLARGGGAPDPTIAEYIR